MRVSAKMLISVKFKKNESYVAIERIETAVRRLSKIVVLNARFCAYLYMYSDMENICNCKINFKSKLLYSKGSNYSDNPHCRQARIVQS